MTICIPFWRANFFFFFSRERPKWSSKFDLWDPEHLAYVLWVSNLGVTWKTEVSVVGQNGNCKLGPLALPITVERIPCRGIGQNSDHMLQVPHWDCCVFPRIDPGAQNLRFKMAYFLVYQSSWPSDETSDILKNQDESTGSGQITTLHLNI